MTSIVKREIIGVEISRGRRMSIVVYEDNAVMLSVSGCGLSETIHLDADDAVVMLNTLVGGIDA